MLDFRKRIGVWGDSILRGVIFDELRGSYQLLADSVGNLITRTLGIQIQNRSRFGSTVDKGRQILEQSLEKGLDCEYVLLEYGGNDCDFDWNAVAADPTRDHQPHTPLPLFKQQMQTMIDLLKERQIKPILMSLPPINAGRYLDFIVSKGPLRENIMRFLGDCQQIYRFHEMYSLAVTGLALRNQCIYIPMRESFLAEPDSPSLLCLDGIHPNERGHRLMQKVFTEMATAQTDNGFAGA